MTAAFGGVSATSDFEFGRRIVFFRSRGFDEGDEISGNGWVELKDDDSIVIEP
jgi:hypothetical protein